MHIQWVKDTINDMISDIEGDARSKKPRASYIADFALAVAQCELRAKRTVLAELLAEIEQHESGNDVNDPEGSDRHTVDPRA